MAMRGSVVTSLLLLLSISAGPAAVASDALHDACAKTLFPDVCVSSLSAKAGSETATPRSLAELSVYVASEVGTAVAAFAHSSLVGVKDANLWQCLDGCSDDIEDAVSHLGSLTAPLTDARFIEIRTWLAAKLDGTSNCEESCKDAPISEIKNAVVTKSLEFDKLLRVALELINLASNPSGADSPPLPF